MQVLLCGGRSALEREYGAGIERAMHQPCRNLVGQDTLVEFLATLARATVCFRQTPARRTWRPTVGTPVIGLYAATNPDRSGPYYSRRWCVDRYGAAALKYRGKPAAALPWTEKIESAGVMDLIEVQDVAARLDELMAAGAPRTPTHLRAAPTLATG